MGYKIAILGATGAVGRQMIEVLREKDIQISELALLSSKRSVGTEFEFKNEKIYVSNAEDEDFSKYDFVLGAVNSDISKKYAPYIRRSGAIFIDNSSAFRMSDDVPLVIPSVNPKDVEDHRGIISNPNCSTIIALTAVNAINALSPIRSMIVSTYQAVSGAGKSGIDELQSQQKQILCDEKIKPSVFPYPIAENLIPCIGTLNDDGYTTEEMKMQNEAQKIFHSHDINITCTCVRVPIIRSHSMSISVFTQNKISPLSAKSAISMQKNCVLCGDALYPMPILSSNKDDVFVGRIREDLSMSNGIALFCCGDQIRRGAATNAVEIMELLM